MKTIPTSRLPRFKALLMSGALTTLICWSVPGFADDSKSDDLRARAEKLLRKAADLKAAGAADESVRLAKEAEELQRAAKRIQNGPTEDEQRAKAANSERLEQVKRLKARLEELVAAGKMEAAAKLKHEIAELGKARDQARPKPKVPKTGSAVALPKIHENAVPHTGSVVEYWPDGQRKSERTYKDGKMVSAVYYASDGTRVYEMSEMPKGK